MQSERALTQLICHLCLLPTCWPWHPASLFSLGTTLGSSPEPQPSGNEAGPFSPLGPPSASKEKDTGGPSRALECGNEKMCGERPAQRPPLFRIRSASRGWFAGLRATSRPDHSSTPPSFPAGSGCPSRHCGHLDTCAPLGDGPRPCTMALAHLCHINGDPSSSFTRRPRRGQPGLRPECAWAQGAEVWRVV